MVYSHNGPSQTPQIQEININKEQNNSYMKDLIIHLAEVRPEVWPDTATAENTCTKRTTETAE